jgi:hypothetical protein
MALLAWFYRKRRALQVYRKMHSMTDESISRKRTSSS